MQKKRVVVTGMGLVSPLGNNLDDFWSNISQGVSGIRPITHFDSTQFPTKLAGEVVDYTPSHFIDLKKSRRMDRYVQFALHAAIQAFSDAKLTLGTFDPYRAHIYIGTATAGQGWVFDQYETFREKGYRKLNPFTAASTFPNAVSSNIAIEFGIKGRCDTISSGCASSLNSVGYGYDAIQADRADLVFVGGSEALLYAPIFGSYSIARVLSTRFDEPARTPRPFDRDRDGTILSEGAGILILESLDHALSRGATIHAEVLGAGFTSDAFHMIAHEPSGIEMAVAMNMALQSANVRSTDIDYVHLHGMGDQSIDRIEVLAAKKIFGDHAQNMSFSAIKSMIGHLQGASGAVELIATILAIRNKLVPPTINLDNPDVDLDLNFTAKIAEHKLIQKAMVNTLGFGGKNASVIIGEYDV